MRNRSSITIAPMAIPMITPPWRRVKAEVFKINLVPLLADVFAGTLLAGDK
jgi:hypothetical protein